MKAIDAPILIVGARSDIGRALAHAYASRGCSLVLAARNASSLTPAAEDLKIRYRVPVSLVEWDVTDPDPDRLFEQIGLLPGTVVLVAGLLGDQAVSASNACIAEQVMSTNYNGPARVLLAAARRMEARGGGTIIGISSVAGERGRASNFIYGSAKAGFTAFLSGLRNSLAKKGIHVLTVKPGFVNTRMTAGMKLPRSLTAEPEELAQAILRAQIRHNDVIYVKPIWQLIMAIIRLIPERFFKKFSL